ncbi:hypothetical protein TNCV_4158791 [Trichonephila clavipes]|nr:hypothetical protein TNCV_4158791 [Trichonephila clavipes]
MYFKCVDPIVHEQEFLLITAQQTLLGVDFSKTRSQRIYSQQLKHALPNFKTAKELTQDLAATTDKTISRQTVYRRLYEKALYARWSVTWVPLNSSQKKARLLCNQEHVPWANQEWGRVLFTDEFRFNIIIDSRRVSFG